MSEKFSLKWNDYQSNWTQSLSELRKETDLADVTLISEDKVKFSAHRILLSSCSNLFKFILRENKNANPLLFLGGIPSQNIGFILDYIYYGEVNIYQEHLDSFLESAQKLEISGLISNDQDNNESEYQTQVPQTKEVLKEEQDFISDENSLVTTINTATYVVKPRLQYSRTPSNDVPKIFVGDMTPKEIEDKTKELYQKIDGVWTCLQCGKTSTGMSTNIRYHVETHLDGLCYTCSICSKEFRSKKSLHCHKNYVH